MPGDSTLTQLIRERYPFPTSHAYSYLESRIDPGDRYQALLTCFEVTLKTITSIGLANLMRDIQEDPGLGNAGLFQDLLDILGRPLSSGHWHQLLHLTLRPYAFSPERLVMPELFHFYYRHYPCTLTGLEIDGHGPIEDNKVRQNRYPEVEPCPSQLYAFLTNCANS